MVYKIMRLMVSLLTRNSPDYLNTIYVFFYTIKKMYSVNLDNLRTTKYAVGKYIDQLLIHTATNIIDLCCNKQPNLCFSFLFSRHSSFTVSSSSSPGYKNHLCMEHCPRRISVSLNKTSNFVVNFSSSGMQQ